MKNELEVGNPLGKWVKIHLFHFLRGVANFKFIFPSHFCTNFEQFGAYLAALMLNFPKHTNFFPFWWISEELWPLFLRSHFFLVHPVDTDIDIDRYLDIDKYCLIQIIIINPIKLKFRLDFVCVPEKSWCMGSVQGQDPSGAEKLCYSGIWEVVNWRDLCWAELLPGTPLSQPPPHWLYTFHFTHFHCLSVLWLWSDISTYHNNRFYLLCTLYNCTFINPYHIYPYLTVRYGHIRSE